MGIGFNLPGSQNKKWPNMKISHKLGPSKGTRKPQIVYMINKLILIRTIPRLVLFNRFCGVDRYLFKIIEDLSKIIKCPLP